MSCNHIIFDLYSTLCVVSRRRVLLRKSPHIILNCYICYNSEKDLELAKHIAYVHQHSTQPPTEVRALPMRLVRRYVALTKRKQPIVPTHLADYIVC